MVTQQIFLNETAEEMTIKETCICISLVISSSKRYNAAKYSQDERRIRLQRCSTEFTRRRNPVSIKKMKINGN